MNKNLKIIAIILAIILISSAIFFTKRSEGPSQGEAVSSEIDNAIRNQVVGFGYKLKNVSLQGPNVRTEMANEYKDYITAELLLKWQNDPENALGRATSSPWPDRIEVVSVTQADDAYKADGNIIEITNADKPLEPSGILPVTFTMENFDGKWLISYAVKGAYSETPQRITVIGKTECLPHKDTSGPQTMECALGIVDEDGKHYALDLQLLSAIAPNYPNGTEIIVEGVFTPVENLSSNQWQKYPIEGIISVTSILDELSKD